MHAAGCAAACDARGFRCWAVRAGDICNGGLWFLVAHEATARAGGIAAPCGYLYVIQLLHDAVWRSTCVENCGVAPQTAGMIQSTDAVLCISMVQGAIRAGVQLLTIVIQAPASNDIRGVLNVLLGFRCADCVEKGSLGGVKGVTHRRDAACTPSRRVFHKLMQKGVGGIVLQKKSWYVVVRKGQHQSKQLAHTHACPHTHTQW